MHRWWKLGAVAASVVAACGGDSVVKNEPAGTRDALATVYSLATNEPALRALAAPREAAFARVTADETDEDSHHRIVSEGWRGAREKNYSGLGVRLPDRSDEATEIGVSRFERTRLRVALLDSKSAAAELSHGRVTYPAVFPDTDRVMLSSAESLEEVLVLTSERAPHVFRWQFSLPEGIAQARESRGGLVFEEKNGTAVMTMAAPFAIDGSGRRIALETRWEASSHTLRLTLRDAHVHYPVMIDPKYETGAWVNVSSLIPERRSGHSMAFDVARNQMVVFGGELNSLSITNETWTYDGVGWTLRAPAHTPPPRDFAAMAYDATRGNIVLFGGRRDIFSVLADTWVWNGTDWIQKAPVTSPPGRVHPMMAFDAARTQAVLFGGYDNDTVALNDTWVWDGTTWTRKTLTTSPSPRASSAFAFDSVRNEIVLFGGENSSSVGETWTWNGTVWTLKSPAVSPSPRTQTGAAFDPIRQQLVMFGGYTTSPYVPETWLWNGSTWTSKGDVGAAGRMDQAMAYDPMHSAVMSFSGQIFDSIDTGEPIFWSGSSWLRAPAPRAMHASAYDSVRREVIMFGGTTQGVGMLADTWAFDGAVWRNKNPALSPPPRSGSRMVYDSARREVVLFGGATPITYASRNDTWVWNGTSWTQKSPAAAPPARGGFDMAFDAARQRVVMFGGYRGSAVQRDTWTWDGTNWTQASPTSKPAARSDHAMAYDSTRQQVVLFGGSDNNGDDLSDTWIWNGSDWTQRMSEVSPPTRASAAMAFNPVRGETLLFGGNSGVGNIIDNATWAWDGTTWTQRVPATAPPARDLTAMAFDESRGLYIMFGGAARDPVSGGLTFLGDTWVHQTYGGACSAASDCAGGFCNDGVCCNRSTCGVCESCNGTTPGHCSAVTNTEDPDTCAFANGKSCSGIGECRSKLGEPAARPADCASGFLVDGVCCESSACGTCQTCDAAKKEHNDFPGRCSAAKAGTDLRGDCNDEGGATCGKNGVCDGNGVCQLYKSGTSCGTSVCNGNRATGQLCSGAGTCDDNPRGIADRGATCIDDHTLTSADGARIACGLYLCRGASCLVACTSRSDCSADADCTPDHACVRFAATPVDGGGGCRASGLRSDVSASPSLLVALAAIRRRLAQKRPCNRKRRKPLVLPCTT